MKKKLFSCLMAALLLVISFWGGICVKTRYQNYEREQRYRSHLLWAIDIAENEDFTEPFVLATLASNIYAAYQFCGDRDTCDQIHKLWCYVLHDSEDPGAKEIILQELKDVGNSVDLGD